MKFWEFLLLVFPLLALALWHSLSKIKKLFTQEQAKVGQLILEKEDYLQQLAQLQQKIKASAALPPKVAVADDFHNMATTLFQKVETATSIVSAMALVANDFFKNIQLLSGQTKEIIKSTEQVKSDSLKFGDKTKDVSNDLALVSTNTNEVAGPIATIATATEELSATINNLSKQTVQVAAISKEATDKVHNSFEVMKELSANSKQISKIINIIEDIADQTNLLSLNATIEAASANEAGAGFAVVASEIKSLANQTINSTNVISEQIGKIQNTVKIAHEETARIQEIIAQVGEFTNTLATSIEEQSFAISDISKTMQTASTSTKNIAAKSESSNKLISTMSSLGGDINQQLISILEMLSGNGKVGSEIVVTGEIMANRISELQEELSEMRKVLDSAKITKQQSPLE
ncbi:MAG: hypothetical protein A2504_11150 [Bdellovibrionales bacterium RIFOXYD12_FULL_39_22]|nr:MAG: hypothetical protein A2385_09715 [Bdellovibrionales bacterium RIFOXYB1_FULL_39_21]OFZ44232.1 MAG: hypothetical protein A2485_07335 [Bdellovibrionales bacterium RIFOXYC12_FULL_39_17]OFZ46774.1 MAG: hypothetical protein A2404_04570 [Bdellovibrionales bacterium RIFOXYC1_FULL_39_130]OFZ75949.1 MAG: hypothetical protein A2560_02580 [Bdellovibrionales bacterium RIFOXYD1_FULL_39_84]OFZ95453.1 MAG: hypothetical protein A2504_11150 [Bdellovibrionales bacterium RIFOXYD12_FULL_39_22]HLE09813.1 me